ARQERGVDLERGVLGGGADQHDCALLHVGQEGVLLRLVESVDLVDEQHGRPPAARALGFRVGRDLADLLPAGEHGGEGGEGGPATCATSRAIVVLPVPGGPQRIIECSLPSSSARRRTFPGPTRWACPTTSSRLRGRIRSARGAEAEGESGGAVSNRSTPGLYARGRAGRRGLGSSERQSSGCLAARCGHARTSPGTASSPGGSTWHPRSMAPTDVLVDILAGPRRRRAR